MPVAPPSSVPNAEPGAGGPPPASRWLPAAALRGLAGWLALAAMAAGAGPAGAAGGGVQPVVGTSQARAAVPAGASDPVRIAAAPSADGRVPPGATPPPAAKPPATAPRRRPAASGAQGAPATPPRPAPPAEAAPAPPPAGPGVAAAAPAYPTRIPPPARVAYRLSRGGIVGSGEIDWQPQGDAYTLRLEGRVPLLGTLIVQTSRGGFDAAGLAPQHYTDKRLRRPERRAEFDRAAGRVDFSDDDEPALPLAPGLQDRLSVMLQLAAIANGWRRPPQAGTELRIPVVGARGGATLWSLRFAGPQSVETADGAVPALRFLREPERPHDTRAEFWLDPARSFMPVRARLTDGHGDALELLRM